MMSRNQKLFGCASCIALTFAAHAYAQETDTADETVSTSGLDVIVVSAEKRAENLQDIPIAITAVSPKRLQDAGIRSVQDLTTVIPTVQFNSNSISFIPRIRGVGATYSGTGIESPVAVFVDDVYRSFAGDINLDFHNVEQVAALTGPQGTLFGRNATGGVIQVTTRGPEFEPSGSLQVSYDSYQFLRSNGFITGPLSDSIAASLSVSYNRQGEGFGTNLATGNDIRKVDEEIFVHGKIRVQAGDRTTINVSADYDRKRGSLGLNFRRVDGRTVINQGPTNGGLWDADQFHDTHADMRNGGATVKIDHDLGFATLSNIVAYRKSHSFYYMTPVPNGQPFLDIPVESRTRQITEEIQLVSSTGGPLSWTIGGFYFHNNIDFEFEQFFYDDGVSTFGFLYQSFPSSQVTDSFAGYAQGTYDITDTTAITAGLRYTHDKRIYNGTSILNFASGLNLEFNTVDARNTAGKLTWRFALEQEFTPDILGYVSYNRGFKSGGFNTAGGAGMPPNGPTFEPEQIDAYEAGLKTELLDNTVRLNLSGFYYDYENLQVNIFTGGAPAIFNAASAKNYGFGLDGEARLTSELTFTANVEYLQAEYKSFTNAPFHAPLPSGGSSSFAGDASGNSLGYSPELKYTIGLTYDLLTSVGLVSFNINDSYNSGFFVEPDEVLKQDAYHITNASIRWTSDDDRLSIRLFANNLLNKAVITQQNSVPWGYIQDNSSPPRIFGGALEVNF